VCESSTCIVPCFLFVILFAGYVSLRVSFFLSVDGLVLEVRILSFSLLVLIKYSRAPVCNDSVSVVYCGQEKKWKIKEINGSQV
jgi:hypothetical protein